MDQKGAAMNPKRGSLANFATPKPSAAAAEPAPPTPASSTPPAKDDRKGLTLRLNPAAWRQLKLLAVEKGAPAHDLLIDAVNDLFRRENKPPIA